MNQPIVKIENGKPMTTSMAIAEVFEREHSKVMRDIANTLDHVSEAFSSANFGRRKYTDSRGHVRDCYHLTKNGFAMTALGFTGARAIQFREAYITRFTEMEARIIADKQLATAQQALLDTGEGELVRRSLLVSQTVMFLHTMGLLPEMTTGRMTAMIKRGELEGHYEPRKTRVYVDSVRDYMRRLGIIPNGIFVDGH